MFLHALTNHELLTVVFLVLFLRSIKKEFFSWESSDEETEHLSKLTIEKALTY